MPDYTNQRKSKMIQVCPKCGRKGLIRITHINSKDRGQITYTMYTHVSYTTVVAGIAFNNVRDWCGVEKQKTAQEQ